MRETKGVVITGKNQVAIQEHLPLPEKPNALGAIIRPSVWSICTSDTELYKTGCERLPYMVNRLAIGHEMCGVVEEVGEDVKDFKPGDRVVVCTKMPNWRSLEAQDGYYRGNADNYFWGDPGPDRGGSFVEHYYMRDADMNLAHIPDGVSMEQAVVITDMMGTSYGGVEDCLNIRFGDTVAVIGVGPVGLMAVSAAVNRGAGRVFAVGSRKVCEEAALDLGATHFFSYRDENYLDNMIIANDGKPVDAVIVCGGYSDELNKGLRILKRGGTLLNLTKFADESVYTMDLSVISHGTGGKNIHTASCAGGRVFLTRMLNMIQAGRVKPERIITHRFEGIEKIPEAMQLYVNLDRSLIKAVVFNENRLDKEYTD